MSMNSRGRLGARTPSQRGLVGCKLSLLRLCVHVEQRLQCGKIREHIDAGLGSFMTYVQVGRPEPPWHTEQVDPLDFLRVQLRSWARNRKKPCAVIKSPNSGSFIAGPH